jgi:hypothetical protein
MFLGLQCSEHNGKTTALATAVEGRGDGHLVPVRAVGWKIRKKSPAPQKRLGVLAAKVGSSMSEHRLFF